MPSLTNLTLRRKIVLLAVFGLFLGGGVFGFLSTQALRQSTEAMLQERLITADLVSNYVGEVLERALDELKNTAQAIEIDDMEGSLKPQVETLDGVYSRLSISTHNILLVDKKGQVIWNRSGYQEMVGVDMSSYPSLSQAMERGEATISGLVSAPVTGMPVFFLMAPIKGEQQATKGMIIVAIDPAQSSIGGFIQPIKLGQTGYVEIIDQNGIVVARTKPGRELAPFEKSDHSGRFAALISAGKATVRTCHVCHEAEQRVAKKDVLAFAPLSDHPWGVAIRQSEEEALAPTYELKRRLLVSGAVLLGLFLVLIWITTQDVVRRIGLLATAAKRMAGGDLTTPVAASGRDEIGTLAQTFDTTRVKLKTSYEELAQRTKELSLLLRVSEILASPLPLAQLLDAAVAEGVEAISGADGGALLLQSADRGGLIVQSATGIQPVLQLILTPAKIEPGAAPILCSIPEQENEELQKQALDIGSAFLHSEATLSRAQSAICAPVVSEGCCIGGLIMISFGDGKVFLPSDLRLLQAIAESIATAVEKAQLAEEAGQARALREADRLKSQFISSVSHELRTPLTSIKGYSTSLLRQDVSWGEETKREFLQIIDEKADELQDLISKLLQISRLESGTIKLEKEPVLIPQLAQKIVKEAASGAKKHKLTLEFPLPFPVVEADPRHVEQVLRNLIENAIKYSPRGGKIAIAGEAKGDRILVSVSDEGIGIPPEYQDKVFERFFRVDSPLTRSVPGSGLGLSIVKGLLEAHDGQIWLESTPGKGSKFYFTLPLGPELITPEQGAS